MSTDPTQQDTQQWYKLYTNLTSWKVPTGHATVIQTLHQSYLLEGPNRTRHSDTNFTPILPLGRFQQDTPQWYKLYTNLTSWKIPTGHATVIQTLHQSYLLEGPNRTRHSDTNFTPILPPGRSQQDTPQWYKFYTNLTSWKVPTGHATVIQTLHQSYLLEDPNRTRHSDTNFTPILPPGRSQQDTPQWYKLYTNLTSWKVPSGHDTVIQTLHQSYLLEGPNRTRHSDTNFTPILPLGRSQQDTPQWYKLYTNLTSWKVPTGHDTVIQTLHQSYLLEGPNRTRHRCRGAFRWVVSLRGDMLNGCGRTIGTVVSRGAFPSRRWVCVTSTVVSRVTHYTIFRCFCSFRITVRPHRTGEWSLASLWAVPSGWA